MDLRRLGLCRAIAPIGLQGLLRGRRGGFAFDTGLLPLLLLASVALLSAVTAAADCFFSDGSPVKAEDRIGPCLWQRSNIDHNTCCVTGDMCLTNGACLHREDGKEDQLYIGGCLSKSGDKCADQCSGKGEIIGLEQCKAGGFACDGSTDCDKDRGGVVDLGASEYPGKA